jgi:hypothetical protein
MLIYLEIGSTAPTSPAVVLSLLPLALVVSFAVRIALSESGVRELRELPSAC